MAALADSFVLEAHCRVEQDSRLAVVDTVVLAVRHTQVVAEEPHTAAAAEGSLGGEDNLAGEDILAGEDSLVVEDSLAVEDSAAAAVAVLHKAVVPRGTAVEAPHSPRTAAGWEERRRLVVAEGTG
jgi:hypothetical protein